MADFKQEKQEMAPQRKLVGGNDPINAQRYSTQRPYSPEDLAQPLYDRKR